MCIRDSGTAAVQRSACFGRLEGIAEVVLPEPEVVDRIGALYVAIARSGGGGCAEEREELTRIAERLLDGGRVDGGGVDAILLAGTDLTTVFNQSTPAEFSHLDCADLHISTVLQHCQLLAEGGE
eukprot:TRINITY_DN19786_c0_g1_i3.p3 TRINITY_DN19786_c0_g1~~TRINITY_DN19786_c0_g1_i3.p3  ORF type:complete len:125 (+),score=46.37 TRINITY_DN19786_c0_g1_i3:171-545(+)